MKILANFIVASTGSEMLGVVLTANEIDYSKIRHE